MSGGKFHPRRGGSWQSQRTIVPKENRTSPDGIVHDSRAEMNRWNELRLLQQGGHVRNLERQVRYFFKIDEARSVLTPTGKVASYRPDFCYEKLEKGEWKKVFEDVKGHMDTTAALRIAVFEAIYQVKVLIT